MKLKNSNVVYTSVFGGYDRVFSVDPEWNCDFVCFTDNMEIIPLGWKVIFVNLFDELPAQGNRRYKMMPHKYLPEYERSLYIDGNIKIFIDPSPLFYKYLNICSIAIPKHQDRNCIYKEALLCVKDKRVEKDVVDKQMMRYRVEGFPENFGMTENGVILRRHNDDTVKVIMNSWWEEYLNGGRRDQLSLPYVSWKYDVDIFHILEGPRVSKKYFYIGPHEADKSKSFIFKIVNKISSNKHHNYFYYALSEIVKIIFFLRNFIK